LPSPRRAQPSEAPIQPTGFRVGAPVRGPGAPDRPRRQQVFAHSPRTATGGRPAGNRPAFRRSTSKGRGFRAAHQFSSFAKIRWRAHRVTQAADGIVPGKTVHTGSRRSRPHSGGHCLDVPFFRDPASGRDADPPPTRVPGQVFLEPSECVCPDNARSAIVCRVTQAASSTRGGR